MLIANTGIIIRMPVDEISRISRSTKGVRIMRLKDDGKVVCVAVAAHEEEVEDQAGQTPDVAESVESVAPEIAAEQNETDEENAAVHSESEEDEQ